MIRVIFQMTVDFAFYGYQAVFDIFCFGVGVFVHLCFAVSVVYCFGLLSFFVSCGVTIFFFPPDVALFVCARTVCSLRSVLVLYDVLRHTTVPGHRLQHTLLQVPGICFFWFCDLVFRLLFYSSVLWFRFLLSSQFQRWSPKAPLYNRPADPIMSAQGDAPTYISSMRSCTPPQQALWKCHLCAASSR